MTKKILFSLILASSIITICFAADLAGKWVGAIDSGDGSTIPITYTFSVEGETVKGTAEAMSSTMPIRNGKVKNDSLFFDVDYNGTPVYHSGAIVGDTIKMELELGGNYMGGVFVKQK